MRSPDWLATFIAVVHTAARLVGAVQNPAPTPALEWGWPTVAEAWTARDERSTINAGYRMFSVPQLGEICEALPSPARLVAKDPIALRIGRWFNFSSLRIVAVDRANRTLPPVPVMLELEEVDPPLFELKSDIIAAGGVTPTRAGRFRIRARTICPAMSAHVVIRAIVSSKAPHSPPRPPSRGL